jgi:hypothetical protein
LLLSRNKSKQSNRIQKPWCPLILIYRLQIHPRLVSFLSPFLFRNQLHASSWNPVTAIPTRNKSSSKMELQAECLPAWLWNLMMETSVLIIPMQLTSLPVVSSYLLSFLISF